MAIRLGFSAADLVRLRFAISPLWETTSALRLLAHPQAGSPRQAWVRWARGQLEVPAGSSLAGLVRLMPRVGYTPDFLSPAPTGPEATIEREIDQVRRTCPDQVRLEIDRSLGAGELDPALTWLRGDPETVLGRLAEAQEEVWHRLVRPGWAAVRDVLDADIAYRSHQASRGGVRAVFADLDPRLSWHDEDGVLVVPSRLPERRDLGGQGLVLMPSSFAWPDVVAVTAEPWQPTVIYPARGVASLWARAELGGSDPLARLLGARRALLLRALATPGTTSRLARQLALSPASVSEHLGVLRDAGLVRGQRTGRVVQYSRTLLGDRLARH